MHTEEETTNGGYCCIHTIAEDLEDLDNNIIVLKQHLTLEQTTNELTH